MIDPLRRTLTQLGALAAHPLAFLILVAYGDIAAALEKAGAHATMITSVRHALILVEHDSLSGAIMIIRSATATATICALA